MVIDNIKIGYMLGFMVKKRYKAINTFFMQSPNIDLIGLV